MAGAHLVSGAAPHAREELVLAAPRKSLLMVHRDLLPRRTRNSSIDVDHSKALPIQQLLSVFPTSEREPQQALAFVQYTPTSGKAKAADARFVRSFVAKDWRRKSRLPCVSKTSKSKHCSTSLASALVPSRSASSLFGVLPRELAADEHALLIHCAFPPWKRATNANIFQTSQSCQLGCLHSKTA